MPGVKYLMKAHGQFDNCAFRSFSKKEHAEQFIAGKIRFTSIYHYEEIKDEKRRDKTEGKSHVVVNSRSIQSKFASNSIYIVSFHRTLQSAKENAIGPFIVEIKNPKQLAEDITEQLQLLPMKCFGGVEGVIVEYTKGEECERELNSVDIATLAYAQKPREPFYSENEFRLVIICKESIGDFFTVQIGRKLDYCKMHKKI
jgi:hypothetical protein